MMRVVRIHSARRVARRLRGRGGFSLAELLIATLILMLATSVSVQSLMIGYRRFFAQSQRAEAELLLASLTTAIQEELTYAEEIKDAAAGEGDAPARVTTFRSYRAGSGSSIYEENGKIWLKGARLDAPFSLVSSGSYQMESGFAWEGNGYSLAARLPKGIIYNEGERLFTVKLEICSSSDGVSTPGEDATVLTESTFVVHPVAP